MVRELRRQRIVQLGEVVVVGVVVLAAPLFLEFAINDFALAVVAHIQPLAAVDAVTLDVLHGSQYFGHSRFIAELTGYLASSFG